MCFNQVCQRRLHCCITSFVAMSNAGGRFQVASACRRRLGAKKTIFPATSSPSHSQSNLTSQWQTDIRYFPLGLCNCQYRKISKCRGKQQQLQHLHAAICTDYLHTVIQDRHTLLINGKWHIFLSNTTTASVLPLSLASWGQGERIPPTNSVLITAYPRTYLTHGKR